MMIKTLLYKKIMTVMLTAGLISLVYTSAQAQSSTSVSVNTVCKTGSDADLPEIKIKIANIVENLKRLKLSKQDTRTSTSAFRNEILAIDKDLGPWRARHKTAAELAGENVDTYAIYKTEWIDTGELARLNEKINLRKTKHQDYKLVRTQYTSANTEFVTLGAQYQYIARDLLDRDRDCAAAKAALRLREKTALE